MAPTLVTAEQVQQLDPGSSLVVPADAMVTALAVDVAEERNVTIVRGAPPAPPTAPPPATAPIQGAALEEAVRRTVAKVLGAQSGAGQAAPAGRGPVKLSRMGDARLEPFPYPGPAPTQQVRAGDVVTAEDGSPMAAGYMTLTQGEFPWTLNYDEVQIVLEGELHLGGDGGGQVGHPGDVFYVPKGSSITFGTPSWAKFIYVTFPANWEDQIK